MQANGRTCELCGQSLPVSYVPPADEDWATGIFGCLDDSNSCKLNLKRRTIVDSLYKFFIKKKTNAGIKRACTDEIKYVQA